MTLHSIPVWKLALFLGLSGLDWLLTWRLMHNGSGLVYEGNPIANWWLASGGWQGLAVFKFGVAGLVGGLCVLISVYRPHTARKVLTFACSVLVVVVLYSSSLAGYMGAPGPRSETDRLRFLEKSGLVLEEQFHGVKEYQTLRRELGAALLDGRYSLREAVDRLAASPMGRQPRWLKILHMHYPDLDDEQCLAANLLEFTRDVSRGDPATAAVMARLEGDFQAGYGAPPPHNWYSSQVHDGSATARGE
jgi:hypothetical protein